ncbi:MAG: hypothetical protein COU35_00430 [Candidatus Magasanikbacteria bacterium CG10_big_fil_rev_8_21_14_0_10_47_10]|uniref:Uncharacterized protein n=1 Tax=Candidatus Magasanikbacteria bacterium CG10_big_fil_rev_8_21_14_0_10_47_10 TaxID=1974652 RepID=A0A2H0TRQ5_9BACT|nr:MAG: hypothetical protein COU35_00430 [Candidatus Magasanikbacteria bacterium CG10_big_fil_rev_8_21_14_0_10_47_10]
MSSRVTDAPNDSDPELEVPDDTWTVEQVEDWLRRIALESEHEAAELDRISWERYWQYREELDQEEAD